MDDMQTLTRRVAELGALAARLDAEPRMRGEPFHGWLARAIGESLTAKVEQMRRDHMTPAQQFQAVLESGLSGWSLYTELRGRFRNISRSDATWGAASAVTVLAGRLREAEMSAAIAQAELELTQQELAALKAPVMA